MGANQSETKLLNNTSFNTNQTHADNNNQYRDPSYYTEKSSTSSEETDDEIGSMNESEEQKGPKSSRASLPADHALSKAQSKKTMFEFA